MYKKYINNVSFINNKKENFKENDRIIEYTKVYEMLKNKYYIF
jgi:hypothetical protein